MNNYRIGELSSLVGLPPKTIRYYEEIGLIGGVSRSTNGYRLFNSNTVDRLRLIKKSRNLGLPINQIKKLINGCYGHSCDHTFKEITMEIESFTNKLDLEIQQSMELKRRLLSLKHRLSTKPVKSNLCCNLLYQLVNKKGGEN